MGKTILPLTVSSKGATLTAPAGSSISLSIKVIFCSLLEEAFPSCIVTGRLPILNSMSVPSEVKTLTFLFLIAFSNFI